MASTSSRCEPSRPSRPISHCVTTATARRTAVSQLPHIPTSHQFPAGRGVEQFNRRLLPGGAYSRARCGPVAGCLRSTPAKAAGSGRSHTAMQLARGRTSRSISAKPRYRGRGSARRSTRALRVLEQPGSTSHSSAAPAAAPAAAQAASRPLRPATEKIPRWASWRAARLGRRCPGQGCRGICKSSLSAEFFREGGAIDRHKGAIAPRTQPMHQPRHQFLAGTAFSLDQHVRVAGRRLARPLRAPGTRPAACPATPPPPRPGSGPAAESSLPPASNCSNDTGFTR